ncbi:MAG TPA: NAD(+) synthase [Dactylosporangium sp.]|jgi:NAD+ synthase (glutamine-hydrolysing)|nr:NAD(+) synthase [Dactylosporangium sp.]
MPRLRLALAQADPTVGDLDGNASLVIAWTDRAAGEGAHVVAFPELMLTGHPVEDLASRESFVAASRRAVEDLAARLAAHGLGEVVVLTGYLDADDRGPRPAVAVLHRGECHAEPEGGVVRVGGVDIALTTGDEASSRPAGLVVHAGGLAYEQDADDSRLARLAARAATAGAVVACVNLVGGQDELVFDGDSLVVRPDGALVARAPQFVEKLLVLDLDLPPAAAEPPAGHLVLAGPLPEPARPAPAPEIAARVTVEAEVWQALVLGLRDYAHKNGFHSVALGLSGGIDSSVVAAIACDALGPAAVVGVSMPGQYSSDDSREDACELARRTGLDFRVEPIQPMVDGFLANLALGGAAQENLQARVRSVVLMALSNQERHLVLTTGNKSELAVGYSTLYGDSAGGFNPLKDVPKTLVRRLARWRNEEADRRGDPAPIPEHSIAKPPSADLHPGQLDTDALPDYEVLDDIIAGYVDGGLGRDELVAAGHDPEVVERTLRMVDAAEYKRRQSPPGTRISARRTARVPITNRFRARIGSAL